MSYINNIGLRAYDNALLDFQKAQKQFKTEEAATPVSSSEKPKSFADTFSDSLTKVNDMQSEKARMVESFVSGENQNVHELMITLQKSFLAFNITSAVRYTVLSAYK